jgi:predicted metal-dependent phosphoesterase TrpH
VIDLHTHTNESDGTSSPFELVDQAAKIGLEAFAICDHDTLAGYDQAVSAAKAAGVDLVCGIELSTRLSSPRERSLHLLGYFLHAAPPAEFRAWLDELQEQRRDRNRRLIAKLQAEGLDIQLSEVEQVGRSLTGRPHFARVLVRKGYAANTDEAFRKYLDEAAPCFVERDAPSVSESIQKVLSAGGLPVLAHPIRLGIRDPIKEEMLIGELQQAGLRGLEVYHSDHQPADVARYIKIVNKYRMAVTGGSDFHGDHRPQVALGTGLNRNLNIPRSVLDCLREISN